MNNVTETLDDTPAREAARQVQRVTAWGLVINGLLVAVKLVTGLVASSQALVADAVHSLSDAVTDVAVLVGARYWSSPADEDHPYGHGRIETIISLFIGLALAVVGGGIAWEAVVSMPERHDSPPGWAAFGAAMLSIAVKEGLYRWTARVGARVKSAAAVANAWHHRSDAFSSIPAAVAVLGARLWPSLSYLDHVGAVIVAVFILQAAWRISWAPLRELIDSGADGKDRQEILSIAQGVPGVIEVHALRTRRIGAGFQTDLHVMVEPGLSVREGHEIARMVKRLLLENGPGVVHALIHVEPYEGPPEG